MICVIVLDEMVQLLTDEGFIINAEWDHKMKGAADEYMERRQMILSRLGEVS